MLRFELSTSSYLPKNSIQCRATFSVSPHTRVVPTYFICNLESFNFKPNQLFFLYSEGFGPDFQKKILEM